MTVLLVLATFFVFVLVDWALNRHKVPVVKPAAQPVPIPNFVDGFLVPDGLRYHPGHTWLIRERPHLARVGVDEFGAKLAGHIEKLDLPRPGQWIRQGQTAWNLFRKGEKAAMTSPIEGEVIEVNQELLRDPSLLSRDPYGKGWLIKIKVEKGTTLDHLMTWEDYQKQIASESH